MAQGGFVAVLVIDLHFPEAESLKAKRKELSSIKAQLRGRLGLAVAEVDHHDLWQRARLTLACVTREYHESERLLADAERYLAGQEYELGQCTRDVVTLDE